MKKEIIENYEYAIIETDLESSCPYSIMSLHHEKEKAENRCKYLNKNHTKYLLGGYQVVETSDKRVKQCWNYDYE